jgi:hypothetical protein
MRNFDYRALGRLKAGQMNKTEAAYANYLEGLKHAGEVLWYRFEGVKLRLADNTVLTIDFAVMPISMQLEMHEVKGFMIDDANVKLKIAAEAYPFVFKLIKRAKWGLWETTEV